MKKKIVTLGEIMLRLSTPGFSRFVQSQSFDATYGGGEANVAVALANYKLDSYFVTKLPKHEIGQSALNHLRRFGVNADFIVRGGDRLGIYFLETGASQRSSKSSLRQCSFSKKLKENFNFETAAITLRESFSASRNSWSAIMIDDKECSQPQRSKVYDIQIVDRVSGGDSFASGLIYGLLEKLNTKDALEFAVAASCLKQTIPGDFNLVTVEEVEKLATGDESGRVER